MSSFSRPPGLSSRALATAACFGLACSFASLTTVLMLFASTSGELVPLVARMKPAPAASEVARTSTRPRAS
jgi:hypothetical protein